MDARIAACAVEASPAWRVVIRAPVAGLWMGSWREGVLAAEGEEKRKVEVGE